MSSSKPFFQLHPMNEQPTFYVYFDNMDEEERFIIKTMIYKLDDAEYKDVLEKSKSYFGQEYIDERDDLEFQKYVVFMFKGKTDVVDMDTLRYVHAPDGIGLHKALVRRVPVQGMPVQIRSKTQQDTLRMGPREHKGTKSASSGSVTYNTRKHGKICLTFHRYKDPLVRNGMNITIQKNIKKETMYGALVFPTHPKYWYTKKVSTVPSIPSEMKMQKMMTSTYWRRPPEDTVSTEYLKQKDAPDNMLIPTKTQYEYII